MRVMKTRPPERNWASIIGPVFVTSSNPISVYEPAYVVHFSDGKKVYAFRVAYTDTKPNRVGQAEFYRGNLGQLVIRASKGVKAEALGADGKPV